MPDDGPEPGRPAATVEVAGAGALDEVQPLWAALREHHRDAAEGAWPTRDADASWRVRREQYRAWLAEPGPGHAWLLLARPPGGGPAVGYALVRVTSGMASWDVGERLGELETLSVLPTARSAGVGALLLERARGLLRDAGVTHWLVGVLDANTGALRFYGREGFRPFYRQLLGPL